MHNGRKRGVLFLTISGLLLGGQTIAADDRNPAISVAMTANVGATPADQSLRESADALFECPPLNIDPATMSCGATAFDFVTLARVPFDHDKFAVNGKAARSLDAAAIYLLLNSDHVHRVFINGHADDTGTDAYNEQLAGKRANAVMKYLINRGVGGDRLAMGSSGERHPVDEYWTPEGRAGNRNVSLYVVMRRPQ